MIDCVIIANENSLPIYSKIYKPGLDETLLLAFFSALKSFAASFMHEDSELKYIHLGNALLDFDNADFDSIGKVNVLMISRDINPTTSHSILTQITERFAIFLDQMFADDPQIKTCYDKGLIPKFPAFDDLLAKVFKEYEIVNVVDMILDVQIPKALLTTIQNIFKISPVLAEMYDSNDRAILEQLLSMYAHSNMEQDLKKFFKNAIKPIE